MFVNVELSTLSVKYCNIEVSRKHYRSFNVSWNKNHRKWGNARLFYYEIWFWPWRSRSYKGQGHTFLDMCVIFPSINQILPLPTVITILAKFNTLTLTVKVIIMKVKAKFSWYPRRFCFVHLWSHSIINVYKISKMEPESLI